MWFVYILETRSGTLYTGVTNDLDARIAEHRAGKGARYTRAFGFRRLLYTAQARTRSAALRREAAIKRLSRSGKLKLVGRSRRHRSRPVVTAA